MQFTHGVRLRAGVIMVAAAFAAPQWAWADNKMEVLETGTVEVVSTTPLAGLGLPVEQVPSNVQVVRGEALQEQQSLGLADYMNQNLQGVNINETQNNPYQPDVNFRGFKASPLVGTPQGLSVYQDGVRINEPFGDTVNWDLVPANAIAGITLMPGSNPLFGLNTLGGALSVTTKGGEHFPGFAAQAYTGSWGRRAAEAEYGGKLDNGFSWFVAGNKFREDGWRDASPSDVRQGFGKLGWQSDKTDVDVSFTAADNDLIGNGYQSQTLMNTFGYDSIYTKPDSTKNKLAFINGKVSHWLSDEWMLTGNAYYRRNRVKTLNGDVNDDYEAFVGDEDFGCSSLAKTVNGVSWAGQGAVVCTSKYEHGVNNRTATTNRGYGLALQLGWTTERNLLIAGLSADLGRIKFRQTEQEADSFNSARGFDLASYSANAEETNVNITGNSRTWSLFFTDTFNMTPKLALTASGRYNHTIIKVKDKIADHEGACMAEDTRTVADCDTDGKTLHQIFTSAGEEYMVMNLGGANAGGTHTYHRFNPALGLAYAFTPELNAYAGYNEGNRAPSPIETGCADSAHPCLLPNAMAGDPSLKQVITKTWEAGTRGKLGDARWSAGVYHTTNHDDLQFISSSTSGAGYFDNVGKTRRKGVDLGLSGALGDFRWSAGYSYVKATYESTFSLASEANSTRVTGANDTKTITVRPGDEIPGIPNHQFKFRGDWNATPNWHLGGTLTAFSEQYAHGNENNDHTPGGGTYNGSGKVKGYTVVNLDTRYNVNQSGWQVFAKVNNLFDRKYYTAGILGENSFNGTNSTFKTDASYLKELFLAPGAPRAAWVGVRYEFDAPKSSAATRPDLD